MSKVVRWDESKNQLLQIQRGLSFDEVLMQIAQGNILSCQVHPNKEKYPNQKIFILKINNYVCYVPFIETDEEIFLKTIIPSRKLNKR